MPAAVVDAVTALARRRGFFFPAGEIYGQSRWAWDFGPLGVELKENVRRQWWRAVVQSREDVVGMDSAVILPPQVWSAWRTKGRRGRTATPFSGSSIAVWSRWRTV